MTKKEIEAIEHFVKWFKVKFAKEKYRDCYVVTDEDIDEFVKEVQDTELYYTKNVWVDDVRPAPDDSYICFKSVNKAKWFIAYCEDVYNAELEHKKPDVRVLEAYKINLIDIDHDAGEYAEDGGDYIELLNWLEETNRNYPIRIHSQNPVGAENMRRIIRRNNWVEVK